MSVEFNVSFLRVEVDGRRMQQFAAVEKETGVLIGTAQSQVVGFLLCFRRLFVAKLYRREGVGRAMVDNIESAARNSVWLRWIGCEVHKANTVALCFYERLGFVAPPADAGVEPHDADHVALVRPIKR